MSSATQLPLQQQQPQQPDAFASSPSPSLADLLTRSPKASIFYEYARDSPAVAKVLSPPLLPVSQEKHTLLVPLNSAILSLARRPHMGPAPPSDGSTTIEVLEDSKEQEQERARFLEKWCELHVLKGVVDLDVEGWETKDWESMLEGRRVGFERSGDAGRKVRVPGAEVVEIVGVQQASNGQIFYLDGTLSLSPEDSAQ